MSYDYDALVSQIASHRREAASLKESMKAEHKDGDTTVAAAAARYQRHLREAVEALETLSGHCPMTPLLWMQYGAVGAELVRSLLPGDESAAAALDVRRQTLLLGLREFPGSALLHLHRVTLLHERERSGAKGGGGDDAADEEEDEEAFFEEALDFAIRSVGRGSHRNEDAWVAALYRLRAERLAAAAADDDDNETESPLESFVERSRVPMKHENEALAAELQEFCRRHDLAEGLSEALAAIEEGRRWEAKMFNTFVAREDEVDAAMHKEGILARYQPEFGQDGIDWERVLLPGDQRYGMGLGGAETANAFLQYARALLYHMIPRDQDEEEEEQSEKKSRVEDEKRIQSLSFAVYERGVAECTTVESLWLAYIQDLQQWIHRQDAGEGDLDVYLQRLQTVTVRAVRNCPYSQRLVEQKLNAVLTLAGHDKAVIDGEQLLETVQQALDTKFLPNQHQCLDLYLAAIRIVKRRLLFLLARGSEPDKAPSPLAYDNAENPASNNKAKSANAGSVDEETIQEVKDLLDDMEEMYDEVDSRIRKTHASWSEGRALLWKERAQTEALLTKTLRSALEDGESAAQVPNTDGEVAASFAKSVRLHNPAHPDLYASYIHNFSAAIVSAPSTPVQVMSNLRRIRFLYENAITSTGKSKSSGAPTTILRDYDTALSSLCQEWIDFERVFGSERSLAQATKMVQKKLRKAEQFHRGPKAKQSRTVAPPAETEISAASAQPAPRAQDATATAAKRKHDKEEEATENVGASDRPSKKQKTESTGLEDVSESKQVENEKAESEKLAAKPRVIHKVKVGDLEHPAHPFTVRILHLSPDTGDMDLVDAFRPKCGSVVHARVVREKSHRGGHGKSKGWALIQFEERDSVEKALELSGSLALHEKTLKVERSHLPAVSLVPAGMHRVRPKGEGKMSKRNEKRREHKGSNEPTKERDAEKPAAGQSKHSEKEAATCVLAFRPRGVGRAGHQKPRLSLDKGATKK